MLRRHIVKWQFLIAIVGIAIVVALLGTATLTVATTIVPDVGGTYVEAVVGHPRWINPILSQRNQPDQDICALVFSSLMRVGPTGELESDLAQKWDVQDEGKTYTFYLRPNVRWHDGHPVTADDVVFTVRAIQDPNYQGPSEFADLWRDTTVEKVSDSIVRFKLKDVYAPFLEYTTQGILPAHILAGVPAGALPQHEFNGKPIGTGPFKVVKASLGEVVLEANADYYGRTPFVSQMAFRYYDDANLAVQALQQEQVQGLGGVAPQSVNQLKENERLNVSFIPQSSNLSILLFNLNDPIFSDVVIRQAIAYGIDTGRLIDVVLNGQGERAYGPVVPQSWAYKQDIKRYDYNPALARTMLDTIGWKDADGDGIRERDGQELRFILLTNDTAERIMAAQEIAKQLEAVGCKVDVQATGWTGVVRDFLVPHKFQAVLAEQLSPNADPDSYQFWHSSQIKSGLNFSSWANRQADDLLEKGRRTTMNADRVKLYDEFQTIFSDELPGVPLYYPVYAFALNQQVKGAQFQMMLQPSDRFKNATDWYLRTKRVVGTIEMPQRPESLEDAKQR